MRTLPSLLGGASLIAALAIGQVSVNAQQALVATPMATFAATSIPTSAVTAVATATSDPLGGATTFTRLDALTPVTLALDYTPNTNHLGIYVAQALGYYSDANINLTIQQAGDIAPEQLVGQGKAEFGISFQDQFTFAIDQAQPIISVAAIIQHNTSALASLHDKHPLKSPADLAGLRYGAYGSPIEQPTLDLLTSCSKMSSSSITVVNVGSVEPIPLMLKDRIDVTWLFYGWDGIRAEQQGVKLDYLFFKDYTSCIPDYYTPIIITSVHENQQNPAVVKAFIQATARGYAYAIQHPDDAAALLIKANPDLDPKLVKASAEWLAPQFQADAPRWGEQKRSIWQGYTDFLAKNKAIARAYDMSGLFTNDYLPGTVTGATPGSP